MKQLWFAAGLLAALLTVTLVSGRYIQSFSDGLTEALVQSQDLARTGHWGQAEQQTQNAYQRWQDNHFYLHTVMQHSDTDQILRKFREVLEYLQIREWDQYTAANADLITQIQLLAEMEQASLVNVL